MKRNSAKKRLPTLSTERLLLRPWRRDDVAAFAALNSDPQVMAHFPALLSETESAIAAMRIASHIERHGFGLWVVEARKVAPFVGVVGLSMPGFVIPFTASDPCVEVGWRLAPPFWGRGYATEAARAALTFGFDVMGLDEIVSFTNPDNWRSRRVMERLGMTHPVGEDFDHPGLPPGHPLRGHVLYRLRAAAPGARSRSSGARAGDAADSRSGGGMTSSSAK